MDVIITKLSSGDILREKNLIDKVYLITLRVVNLNKLYFFSELDAHVDDVGLLGSHRNLLVRKIVCSFVTMKAKHFCKEKNAVDVKIRMQLSKLILFKNQ